MDFKNKYLILLITFFASYFSMNAEQIIPVNILWESPRIFSTPSEQETRLSFEDAQYIDELPFYTISVPIEEYSKTSDYKTSINDCKYEPLNTVESNLLKNANIADSIIFRTSISTERHNSSLDLRFCPIILKDGKYQKLISAKISINTLFKTKKRNVRIAADAYPSNSVLASGYWVKLAVRESGIYKLTYEEIVNMGVSSPANIRIFGYGGEIQEEDFSKISIADKDDLKEIAIFMEKGSDEVFGSGDYILFWAQGVIKRTYNDLTGGYEFTPNYYTDYGYYFATSDAGIGRRIEQAEKIEDTPTLTVNKSLAGVYHNVESINLLESGREWYGEKFESGTLERNFQLPIENVATDEDALLNIEAIATSSSATTYTVSFNGNVLSNNIKISAVGSSHQVANSGSISRNVSCSNFDYQTVTLKYNPAASSNVGYLNYITLSAYKHLNFNGSSMEIFYPNDIEFDAVAGYEISGATSSTKIWNITDQSNITEIPTEYNGTLSFTALHNDLQTFLALNTQASFPAPTIVGAVANQNLHGLAQCDMIIVTPSEYMAAAERLAEHHRTHDGMVVHIATPEQIYNEFSSGTPDATAYRRFLKVFYDRAASDGSKLPSSLLFFGVASHDNRGYKHAKLPLISYQSEESLLSTRSYVTDDYYGLLDDNEGGSLASDKMDISVGRLPISSNTEAENGVNKIIKYAQNSLTGTWKNIFAFMADDEDSNIHMSQADKLSKSLYSLNKAYQAHKVYFDAYPLVQSTSGGTYPVARETILKDIKNGVLVFTYVGHGGPYTLSQEQTINQNDIIAMYNDKQALWITATCDFSRYDNNTVSAGMNVFLNPNGGGIALLTTTRVVFSSDNFKLGSAVYDYIVPKEGEDPLTLGEIVRRAKIDIGYDKNKLNFSLLGDPALVLNYPTKRIITDSINSLIPEDALMQALGLVTIKGHIADENGDSLKDFNGTVNLTIYDKEETMTTLANKGNTPFNYQDYPNILFSGKASATNGCFETTFMVPKDINYKFGNGRILYYGVSDDKKTEAHDYNESFQVGGSDPSAEPSEEGPNLKLYLNSPSFISGQVVNPTPVLFAHLNDSYGINVVGAGIGHDITIKLNNDPNKTYVLNNYYESTLNDYKSGIVKYQFEPLEPGLYHLAFKAWNLQNISSSAEIDFVIREKSIPEISDFSISPNPASDYVDLTLLYDRPEIPVDVEFILYDMQGRQYWNSKATVSTEGTYTSHIDLSGKIGDQIRPGIYLIKAIITTTEGTYDTKTQKLLVNPQ